MTRRNHAVVAAMVIQLSFSCLAMGALVLRYRLNLASWLLHFLVVLCLTLIFLGLSGLIRLAFPRPPLKFLAWIPAPLLCSFLNLTYASNWLSRRQWGQAADLELIWRFLGDAPQLLREEGVQAWAFWAALAALALVSGIPFLTAGELPDSARNVFWGAKGARRLFYRCLGLLLLAAAVISYLPSGLGMRDVQAWDDEPLSSLFYNNFPTFAQTDSRRQTAAEDRLAEKHYRPPAGPRPNLALFIVDDLRADRLPGWGYSRPTSPFLDSMLAAGAFRRSGQILSTGSESVGGILGILASRQTDLLCDQNFGLISALRRAGYRITIAYSGNEHWYNLAANYGAKDGEYLFHDGKELPSADDRQVLEALKALPAAGAQPVFFFIHLMSVHWVGAPDHAYDRYLPQSRGGEDLLAPKAAPDDAWLMRRGNYYDNRVLQADGVLRQAWGLLKSKGYTAGMKAVLCADHGEGLGDHPGNIGHGQWLYLENLNVPALFYGLAKNVKLRDHGSSLDLAPTLMAMAGLPVPPTWAGIPLQESLPQARILIHASSPLTPDGATAATWMEASREFCLIRNNSAVGSATDSLFDVRSDPKEQHPLAPGREIGIRLRLAQELDGFRARCTR